MESNNQQLVFPQVTDAEFVYLPIGFVDDDVIIGHDMCVIRGATFYHFGVLVSSVHRAWLRTVGTFNDGKMIYKPEIVYNNFVWPYMERCRLDDEDGQADETTALRERICATAKGILDARNRHPEMNLGELYTDSTMPADLREAHLANDAAVLAAYGLPANADDMAICTFLFNRYAELEGKEKAERLIHARNRHAAARRSARRR